MKLACLSVILAFALCGCDKEQAQSRPTTSVRDPKLDSYFERYCDYTGGMGIGFVASHTYDFEFRQRLKTTQDAELKRLFVLQHLYRECDLAISDFEKGIVMTGKSSSREMTPEERASTRSSIGERLDDLSRFDPGDPQRETAEFLERLNRASQTNQAIPKYEYKVEAGYIVGPALKWPLKGSDAGRDGDSLWPSDSGLKLLNERWKNGAKTNLSTNDTSAIRKVVLDKLGKDNPQIGEIKKITEREYMAHGSYDSGPLAAGAFYFVLVRSEDKWIVIGQYCISIS